MSAACFGAAEPSTGIIAPGLAGLRVLSRLRRQICTSISHVVYREIDQRAHFSRQCAPFKIDGSDVASFPCMVFKLPDQVTAIEGIAQGETRNIGDPKTEACQIDRGT